MIRFNVAGQYLDLPDDFNLQFTKKNILFAFDNIECERSTSFDVPATPNNNAIFSLSKWVACTGVGMRRQLDAQMQAGVVTKDGYLYIDAFDYKTNVYKAIFVTGDLLGLKKIKDAGNIPDIIYPYDTTNWGGAVNASAAQNAWWKCVKYMQQFSGTPYPSVQVSRTIQECITELGELITLPTGANQLRIIPAKLEGVNEKITFSSTPHVPANANDVCNNASVTSGFFEVVNSIVINDVYARVNREGTSDVYWTNVQNSQICKMQGFKAKVTVSLTFPSTMPTNIGLITSFEGNDSLTTVRIEGGYNASGNPYPSFNNRDGVVTIYDNSLAGKTLTIAANTYFAFCKLTDIHGDGAIHYMTGYYGKCLELENGTQSYATAGAPAYTYDAEIKTVDPAVGVDVMLWPHLPQCTLVDLLKLVANVYGQVLNYDNVNGVTFETLNDMLSWPQMDLTGKVIAKKTMERKFSDYGQNNVVYFDSEDYVGTLERLKITYTIDNQNIEAEKELQKIIFSEGAIGSGAYTNYQPVLIKNADEQSTDKATLCLAGASDTNLGRVYLTKNAKVQQLCTASTAVKMDVKMTLLEFNSMVAKSLLTYEGVRYVWTEAQWSKGVATLNLSKI